MGTGRNRRKRVGRAKRNAEDMQRMFVQMQLESYWVRRKLARDLMRQTDLRKGAKRNGKRFRMFLKEIRASVGLDRRGLPVKKQTLKLVK